ncbi:cell adhesion molecule CEACAM16-like isoform X3 [Engystomops pustulosus]|uniref:cell adhesion molecule CEACAM16-like isoform X3 n=1 Tax=Engystomops pustulosus TaxID=76066 RepID=UPI003AFB40D7
MYLSRRVLLPVLLGLVLDVTSGSPSLQLIPQYPVINGSVTMTVTGITGNIVRITWYKGPNTDAPYFILTSFPGGGLPTVFGPQHNARISALNNGSLHIKDLQLTDRGNYIAKIQTDKTQLDLPVMLEVYEPVTKPKITASSTSPKENDSLSLTCDTSRAMRRIWTRRGASISSEATLSGENRTLSFRSVGRGDSGEYQCEAENLVSKESSDPYTVTVAYGPDNVRIEGTVYVKPGSSITFTCSADSLPPPEYEWKVNGTTVQEKTNKYRISEVIPEDEGTYTCVVRNAVTLRTAAASVYLNVTESQTDNPAQSPEQHELQYADIDFSKNPQKKQQQPEVIYENRSPQNAEPTDNVVYSELKLR